MSKLMVVVAFLCALILRTNPAAAQANYDCLNVVKKILYCKTYLENPATTPTSPRTQQCCDALRNIKTDSAIGKCLQQKSAFLPSKARLLPEICNLHVPSSSLANSIEPAKTFPPKTNRPLPKTPKTPGTLPIPGLTLPPPLPFPIPPPGLLPPNSIPTPPVSVVLPPPLPFPIPPPGLLPPISIPTPPASVVLPPPLPFPIPPPDLLPPISIPTPPASVVLPPPLPFPIPPPGLLPPISIATPPQAPEIFPTPGVPASSPEAALGEEIFNIFGNE